MALLPAQLLLALSATVAFLPAPSTAGINILHVGAKRDGRSDSTDAFRMAWAYACQSTKTMSIYVPKGRYLLRPVVFQGPCRNNNMRFVIDGELVASSDRRATDVKTWINFNRVDGLEIRGGRLDGKGTALWSCKLKKKNCPLGPPSLTIGRSKNVKIIGLTSVYSKFFHIFVFRSHGVKIQGGHIIAPAHSPNTDGIHVQMSTDITIVGTKIMTGDDCISIGPGTSNMWMEKISCGPGHGVSIGSLGHVYEGEGVRNITLRNSRFVGTQNGLRIKTWGRPSKGFVTGVLFDRVTMTRVENPINIDQTYCPWYNGCPSSHSGIEITNVVFRQVKGTSATKVAVALNCSPANPCRGIVLQDVKLTYQHKPAMLSCRNVRGKAYGGLTLKNCR